MLSDGNSLFGKLLYHFLLLVQLLLEFCRPKLVLELFVLYEVVHFSVFPLQNEVFFPISETFEDFGAADVFQVDSRVYDFEAF